MEKKYVKYCIGFYKFTDAKIWHRSQVLKDKEELKKYLEGVDYVDKSTINIIDIELPE
tara:strand:- start:857 stop:1030 length:174 start_codon:yes stop_codon:yes gene_type:complete